MTQPKSLEELAEEYAEKNDGKFQYCSDWAEVVEIYLAGHAAALESAEVKQLIVDADMILRNPIYTSRLAIAAWDAALKEFRGAP